jgi:hypothetical protein
MGVLEDSMRYTATVGWMVMDQMALVNERIPLHGVGGFEQLYNDLVDYEEKIKRIERVHEEMEEEIHCTNNAVYWGCVELEEQVEYLEEANVELRSGLHWPIMESQRLMWRVSELSQRVAGYIHNQRNSIIVEDSPGPGPSRLPQLPEDHLHCLVLIKDLSGSLCYIFTSYFPLSTLKHKSPSTKSTIKTTCTYTRLSHSLSYLIFIIHLFLPFTHFMTRQRHSFTKRI